MSKNWEPCCRVEEAEESTDGDLSYGGHDRPWDYAGYHRLCMRELEFASQNLEAKNALKEHEAEGRARLWEENKV